jgi:PPE-repeat protein
MVLDFGAIPPEINSARMYAGPGSGSLMAAAAAWNALAAELNAAALAYDKVITALNSEEWLGPASASMAQAVTPYMTWMSTTAAQAEEAAIQARTAAAAYETALAATVPPPLIAANRAQVMQLMQTNVLGQNTPAITQLEAQYGEMWAQDATAMYSYAGQSAAATKVTPYTSAPQIANPAAQATQGAAVTSATATSAGSAQSTLSQMVTQTPTLLQSMGSPNPAQQALGLTGSSSLKSLVEAYLPFSSLFYNTEGLPYFSVGMGNFGVQMAKTMGLISAPASAAPKALPALGGLGGLLGGGAGAVHPAAAALGNAASVGGKLSVPVSWTGASAAPAISRAAIPVSTVSAAPEAAGGPGNLLGGMPLAGMGSGGTGGAGPRYGFRPTVMARPPFAG